MRAAPNGSKVLSEVVSHLSDDLGRLSTVLKQTAEDFGQNPVTILST
ncbi:MAG: hypothetical protein Q4A44_03555 [Bacteroidales bacterium]|nr:hypothetical protein [Bacteroidales bacterium]